MITRRGVLHRVVLGGAAVFVGTVPGTKAAAQPLPRRREINSLALNDPIVETLREGVKLLKARPPGGPNWTDMSNIHGTAAGFNKCPHGTWYFLPWHRAYVLMYERMIRSVTGNNAFAMPYWDWSANRPVPLAFRNATYNGQPNPLYVATRNNGWSVPDIYSGPAVMSNIYGQTDFELFGTSRRAGQNNLNPSWIKGPGGVQGTLEATPHNNIHVNLGGFMPNGNSPMDPIFQMHHCNIDRIWWRWNCLGRLNTADPLWRDMPFTDNFYNPDGTWRTWMPSQLTNIARLGYSYGLCLRPILRIPLRVLASARLRDIFKAGRAVRARPEGGQVLQLQTRRSGAAVEAAGTAAPRSLRNTFLNISQRRQVTQLAGGQRTSQIVALIHNLTPPSDNVEVLVFAGTSDLRPVNDPKDPSFVTSIGFFGPHDHNGEGLSASVDLTEHLRGMPVASDRVHVRLVARPTGRTDGKVEQTVAKAEVEVLIV